MTARHQVRRAFAVTGLDRTIPLARTRAEALASLHAGRDTGPGRKQPPAGSPGAGRDR